MNTCWVFCTDWIQKCFPVHRTAERTHVLSCQRDSWSTHINITKIHWRWRIYAVCSAACLWDAVGMRTEVKCNTEGFLQFFEFCIQNWNLRFSSCMHPCLPISWRLLRAMRKRRKPDVQQLHRSFNPQSICECHGLDNSMRLRLTVDSQSTRSLLMYPVRNRGKQGRWRWWIWVLFLQQTCWTSFVYDNA